MSYKIAIVGGPGTTTDITRIYVVIEEPVIKLPTLEELAMSLEVNDWEPLYLGDDSDRFVEHSKNQITMLIDGIIVFIEKRVKPKVNKFVEIMKQTARLPYKLSNINGGVII